MGSHDTARDTEYAGQADRSSAGLPTQSLTFVSDTLASHPSLNRRNNMLALAMIAVGVCLFIGRAFPDRGAVTGGIVLLTMASCFFFFAFWKRIYGLVIPGALLAGLSLGVTFAAASYGISIVWGLALGLLAIRLLGQALFNRRSNWPIYPAIPLFAVGVIIAAANLPTFLIGSVAWLPILLIGAGLYLGWCRQHA